MGAGCQEQPGVAHRCFARAVGSWAVRIWLLGAPAAPRLVFLVSYRPLARAGPQTVLGCLIHQSNDPRNPHDLRHVRCSHPPAHMRPLPRAIVRTARHSTGIQAVTPRAVQAHQAPAVLRNITRTKYNEAVAETSKHAQHTFRRHDVLHLHEPSCNARERLVNGFCACGDRDGVDAGMTGVAHVSCLSRCGAGAG